VTQPPRGTKLRGDSPRLYTAAPALARRGAPRYRSAMDRWLFGVLARIASAAMTGLPDAVLRLLSGRRATRIDGLTLDAEVQLMLALLGRIGHRGLDTMTPEEARADTRRSAELVSGIRAPVARVESLEVPGAAAPMAARLYVPSDDGAVRPLVLYLHGGGWVVGDLDTHDGVCRFLAREADAGVLAVDYRLAPEHPFPAAVDDAVAALRWASAHAAGLGFDPRRVAVAGDSAGGNLSAVVSLVTAATEGPKPVAQLLIYPVTDLATKHPSYRLFSRGFFLTEAEMDWYRGHYLPSDEAARDERASPLRAGDLAGLPPAIVLTAGFDVLRDEGEAYAARLGDAGVPVHLHRAAGQVHGFANATAVSPSARAALRDGIRALVEALSKAA
jgi:acetyl esterase